MLENIVIVHLLSTAIAQGEHPAMVIDHERFILN
jgi:hypothetical protein